MRILGIDPGLTTAGLGLVETSGNSTSALDWCTISTDPTLAVEDRLLELNSDLETFLDEMKPELAVVEQVYFATNKKSAIDVSHARGVILLSLKKREIPIVSVTPLQLKMAITGDGKADKKQMQTMVQRTLNLKTVPSPWDAADALALALYGAFHHARGLGNLATARRP